MITSFKFLLARGQVLIQFLLLLQLLSILQQSSVIVILLNLFLPYYVFLLINVDAVNFA